MSQLQYFKKAVWNHYRLHRRDFPWRNTRDPYRILVSEIMLQQTQAPRVIGFYEHFLRFFPTPRDLAAAPLRKALAAWQGLGYNRRLLMLRETAGILSRDYGGKMPKTRDELEALPGIGAATAGAILAYAFQIGTPFIETNIRRVFIHSFFHGKDKVPDAKIMPFIEKTLDKRNPRNWYYALMDYGAFLGKTIPNPNRRSASYQVQSRFKGSVREARGRIIRILLKEKSARIPVLLRAVGKSEEELTDILKKMEKDGFLRVVRGIVETAS